MLLLTRPPYLRWFAATAIVVAALAWDLSGRSTAPVPVAARPIERGQPITVDDVRWTEMPAGAIAVPVLDDRRAAVDIREGDPITASVTSGPATVPDDWWAVPMEVPLGLPEGSQVRLLLPSGRSVDGIVAAAATEDVFSGSTGAVAVAAGDLDEVARAAAAGAVSLAIRP